MKKALIVIFLLGLLAIIGQLLWVTFFGKGAAVVFAPGSYPVMVTADAGQAIRVAAGGHHRLELSKGEHTVRLELGGKAQEHKITIESGHNHLGLPVLEEQCFVALDVTSSHYKRVATDEANQPLPFVSKRYREKAAFHVPRNYYFSVETLPESAKEQIGVYLFSAVPCNKFELPDTELVRSMGYQGRAVQGAKSRR